MASHALLSERRAGILLGLVSALSTATALRPPGQVGPAEVLLVLWCAFVWLLIPRASGRLSPVTGVLLFVAALGVGSSALQQLFGWARPEFTYLTLGALALSLLVLFTVDRHRPQEVLRAWARTFGVWTVLLAVAAFLLPASFVNALGFPPTGAGSLRFTGFANNPNQLAGFLIAANCALVIPPLSRHSRAWTISLIAGSCLLILATASDSGRIALLFGLVVIILMVVRSVQNAQLRVLAFLSLPVLVALGWGQLTESWASLVSGPLREENDQLGVRQSIWNDCLSTLAENPLIGTGNNRVTVGGRNTIYAECHNFFVEGGVIGGLVALGAVVSLVILLAVLIFRHRAIFLGAGLTSMVVFQLGNSSIRFHLLWLVWAAIFWQLRDPAAVDTPNKVLSNAGSPKRKG